MQWGSPIFQMRLPAEDRQRLDTLAAQAGTSRAQVFKSLLRSAEEPPGEKGDCGVAALTDKALAATLSDR